MPTLNRARDGSHYYIRSLYEGTWQVSDKALPEVLSKYPRVAGYAKEEIPSSYLQHLKQQGWLFRRGDGRGYLPPWEYRKEHFADLLDATGIAGRGYPELAIRLARDAKTWDLGISLPAIPGSALEVLSAEEYRALVSDRYWIAIDGKQRSASNLLGERSFVPVRVRSQQAYRVTHSLDWPESIDATYFDCSIEPPNGVTVFQPPSTYGRKLCKPRLAADTDIVVLLDRTNARTRYVSKELEGLFDDEDERDRNRLGNAISRGSLRDTSDWDVYWINVPKPGSRLWNLLANEAGIQEARSRWLLDLVTPLATSIDSYGVREIPTAEPILVRAEHSPIENIGASDEDRMLVWEHGGTLLRAVEGEQKSNPQFLEVLPPLGVKEATLWVYGADASPAWLSFRIGARQHNEDWIMPSLSVTLRLGNDVHRLSALTAPGEWPLIEIVREIDSSRIQVEVDLPHDSVKVKCCGRSLERFVETYVDSASSSVAVGAYLARMARIGQPIELEFDAGTFGYVGVRFTPRALPITTDSRRSQIIKTRQATISGWQTRAFARMPVRWVHDRSGRGHLIGSRAIDR